MRIHVVPKGNREARRLGSAAARLKLKGIGGSTTTGGACGLIGPNAGKLTGDDSGMRARLMTLLD